ncbi:hypothetical protein GCM10025734_12640 [Kitasatospora paranensis]
MPLGWSDSLMEEGEGEDGRVDGDEGDGQDEYAQAGPALRGADLDVGAVHEGSVLLVAPPRKSSVSE